MRTVYSKSIEERPNERPLLEEATCQLEEILGSSAATATAAWDFQQDDQGKPLYWLTLKDWNWEVSGKFAPDELRSPHQMRFRLNLLWGDLLQKENRPRIERIKNRED